MKEELTIDLYKITNDQLNELSDEEIVSLFNENSFSFIGLKENELLYKRLNSIIGFEIRLEPLEGLRDRTKFLLLSILNEKVSNDD